MRPCPAMVLADWILMFPPVYKKPDSPGNFHIDASKPVSSWTQWSVHDKAKDCQDSIHVWVQGFSESPGSQDMTGQYPPAVQSLARPRGEVRALRIPHYDRERRRRQRNRSHIDRGRPLHRRADEGGIRSRGRRHLHWPGRRALGETAGTPGCPDRAGRAGSSVGACPRTSVRATSLALTCHP